MFVNGYMGQYYHPINLDKQEWLYSHDYDNGLKLMEHSWLTNDFVSTVESLLTPGNSWYRNRIVWSGDYADDFKLFKEKVGINLSNLCVDKLEDRVEKFKFIKIKPEIVTRLDKKYQYIVNHSKKLFVNKKKVPKSGNGWKIHPLPLLTCQGNGQGGGDYYGEDPNKLIGSWAGDNIGIELKKPDSTFSELIFDLVE